jgi:hypothetical protein
MYIGMTGVKGTLLDQNGLGDGRINLSLSNVRMKKCPKVAHQ